MTARVTELATRLLAARRSGVCLPALTAAEAPRDLKEAYAVQAAVTAGLGEMVGGYKVGFWPDGTGLFAPILRSRIVGSGSTVRVAPFERIGVELEFGFRFGRQVSARSDRTAVLAAIDAVVVTIELCQSRYQLDLAARLPNLADHQLNSGAVLGASGPLAADADLKGASSRWLIDGVVLLEKSASHPTGDPLAPLAVLPALLAERGQGIEPGHIVITGSLNGVTWLEPPRHVEGVIDGFGSVAVDLAA